MAFSFKNTANQIQKESTIAVAANVPVSEEISAYSNDTEDIFQKSEKYKQYEKYRDENYSHR